MNKILFPSTFAVLASVLALGCLGGGGSGDGLDIGGPATGGTGESGGSDGGNGESGGSGNGEPGGTGGTNSTGGTSSTGGTTSTGGANGTGPQLTDEEAVGICEWYVEELSAANFETELCRMGGVWMAALVAAFDPELSDVELRAICSELEGECLDDQEGIGSCEETTAPDQCTSSPEEIQACLADEIAQMQDILSSFPTCSNLTRAGLMDVDFEEEPPASCETVDQNCPGLRD